MDASERRKRASSEAADWFARLQAGEMDHAERQQYVEWLRESYVHVTEMLRIAQIHGELKQFGHWARLSTGPKTAEDNVVQLPAPLDDNLFQTTGEGRGPRHGKGEGHQRPPLMLFAVAATVVLVVATALVLPRIRGQVIETERGERREVVLSDGSVLQVDPETRLRVKYADAVRQVFLERGRALFHVAKNAHRPFLVQADGTTVRAVGTAFGVEQQTRGVTVTVAEGKVAVFGPSQPLGDGARTEDSGLSKSGALLHRHSVLSTQSSALSPTLFLTADQQVTVPNIGATEPVRKVDSHRALAWAEGRLIFQNDELGTVIAQFNRYNHVQLSVVDPALAAKPVSGVFNAADPEAFIAFLQSVTAVEIVRDGDRGITIATARRP
jgi:transmembrane sensor